MQLTRILPDIAKTRVEKTAYTLKWVGMDGIAVPITLDMGEAQTQTFAAKANVYVSLDNCDAKGIHMSRLHGILNQFASTPCDRDGFNDLLAKMVDSQSGLSQSARIELAFDLLLAKNSLLSNETGFQTYSVEIHGQRINDVCNYALKIVVPYSSTCPCSAALSGQLKADAIDARFKGANMEKTELLSWVQANSIATPHSQRSFAYLNLSLGDAQWPALPLLIWQVEEAIGTPVQTMVKRNDEQEFARLNANNLMFCEDAARKIKALLEQSSWIKDYWFKVEHQESLHAHNAVVIDQKFAL